MAVKVMMPKGSDTMTDGKVLKWLKNEGDAISTGDAIVEIETDKVNMEVEAMGAGILRKIIVPAGSAVPVPGASEISWGAPAMSRACTASKTLTCCASMPMMLAKSALFELELTSVVSLTYVSAAMFSSSSARPTT